MARGRKKKFERRMALLLPEQWRAIELYAIRIGKSINETLRQVVAAGLAALERDTKMPIDKTAPSDTMRNVADSEEGNANDSQ